MQLYRDVVMVRKYYFFIYVGWYIKCIYRSILSTIYKKLETIRTFRISDWLHYAMLLNKNVDWWLMTKYVLITLYSPICIRYCHHKGQNLRPEESSRLAVLSAIKYHRDNKSGNSDVSFISYFSLTLSDLFVYSNISILWLTILTNRNNIPNV